MRYLNSVLLLFFAASSGFPQTAAVQVGPNNKTISVTADHIITVEPEIAFLRFGFRNNGLTKDVAYRENVNTAGKILKALKDAGITADAISTQSLRLERQKPIDNKPVKPELLLFDAYQEWTVSVEAKEAQAIIDLAVQASANDVSDPEWTVADPVALEAQAYGAALAKARKIAEQMAHGLGAQLGDLVYASNSLNMTFGSPTEYAKRPARTQESALQIFPKKVERIVQVVATFAVK